MIILSMARFAKALKKKASQLVDDLNDRQWDISIPSMIRREIALAVDQTNRLKELHKEQLNRLLRIECYVDTELKQLEQRIPRYVPHHFPEKEKLRKRLFEIEGERRKLALRLEDKNRSLEDRLLTLINRHEQLDIN